MLGNEKVSVFIANFNLEASLRNFINLGINIDT